MAAEGLSAAGVAVQVFDAMPSVGRKFLLAGKGGLNLTHAEPLDAFVPRYAKAAVPLQTMLQSFGATEVRAWAQGLGINTFVGTSQRVFPTDMKAAPLLRDQIAAQGHTTLELDLLPQWTHEQVLTKLKSPRGSKSLSSHLKARLGLEGIKTAVLYEFLSKEEQANPQRLAAAIKGLPIHLGAARPIDEAISSAGGVCWQSLDEGLMIKALPGVYCAGEMVDWEAPTGGYLLTVCLSSGHWAARALLSRNRHLKR